LHKIRVISGQVEKQLLN